MQIKAITLPHDLLKAGEVSLPTNGITVLVGRNGSGKSTLLQYLAHWYPKAAYLPQSNQIYDELTVAELLEIGSARAASPLTVDVLAALELADLMATDLRNLSGGQQQRVWLAFCLVQNAPLVLLDEPLNALDLRYQQRLLALLTQIAAQFIVVIHDLNYARQLGVWSWLLHDRQLLEGTPQELLTAERLSAVFATPIRLVTANDGTEFLQM